VGWLSSGRPFFKVGGLPAWSSGVVGPGLRQVEEVEGGGLVAWQHHAADMNRGAGVANR
jgi:hypothetical protein